MLQLLSTPKIKISRRESQIRDEASTFIKVNQKDFFHAVSEIGKKFGVTSLSAQHSKGYIMRIHFIYSKFQQHLAVG